MLQTATWSPLFAAFCASGARAPMYFLLHWTLSSCRPSCTILWLLLKLFFSTLRPDDFELRLFFFFVMNILPGVIRHSLLVLLLFVSCCL